jgi:hypothetical protein
VSPDDRAERLDHQRFGDRVERSGDSLRVSFGISVADDHADALAAIDLTRQLDDPIQRAIESPYALQRGDEPVADAQDGLDLKNRTQKCVGPTDSTSAAQELQRGD